MRYKWISLCIALVLLLSACKKEESPAQTAGPDTAETPKPTLAAPAPTPMNARVLSDLAGNEVEIPSQPKQIISLSPAVTEILYALNSGSALIGADHNSSFPAEAAALPRFSAEDTAAIIAAAPQVVFVGRDFPADAKAALQAAGIAVAMAEGGTYSDAFFSISFLAGIMGADSSPLIMQMNEKVMEVESRDFEFEPVSALLVLSDGADGSFLVAGDNSLFNELITMVRSQSATAGTGLGDTLSADALLQLDPQVVLVDAAVGVDAITASATYSKLSAVEADRVFPIDAALVTRGGPRMGEGLLALYSVLEQAANS